MTLLCYQDCFDFLIQLIMTEREVNLYLINSMHSNYPKNHFDSIISKMTEQIKIEIIDLGRRRNEDVRKQFLTEMKIYILQKELFSLYQMRIVYLYMQFEIHLKKMISLAYGESKNGLYKWNDLIKFFKTRNIDLIKLNFFSDINNIRVLNNSIKHSEELLNDKTRNIPEFKGRNSINSATINIFYDRIMDVQGNL